MKSAIQRYAEYKKDNLQPYEILQKERKRIFYTIGTEKQFEEIIEQSLDKIFKPLKDTTKGR